MINSKKNTIKIIVIYNQTLETPHRPRHDASHVIRPPIWRNPGNFYFQNPESRKFLLVESWIQEIFASRILNPGKFCLCNPELWTLKSRQRLKDSKVPVTIGIRDPSFTDKESGIQYLESGIHNEESVIQDCLGFPYIRWNTNKTSFIYVILLTSRRRRAQLVSGLIYPIE